jgi:hypothetical protein
MSDVPPKFSEMNPAISVSDNLERVVLKTLAKKPEERFQNMAEFKDALQAAVYNDQAIEIPASLLVSRHAVPALSSSASIPALKSSAGISAIRSSAAVPALRDQSETRLLTELRPNSGGGGGKGLLMGAAVLVGLAAAGAGAWYIMDQQPNKIVKAEGNIWCYNKKVDPGFLEVRDAQKGTIQLTISDLDKVKHIKDIERDSPLGLVANVEFKGKSENSTEGELTSITIKSEGTPESLALNTVTDFMFKITTKADDELVNAQKMTDNIALEDIKKEFEILLKKERSSEIEPPNHRFANAERIIADDEKGVVLLVYKKAYDQEAPQEAWQFTIDPKKTSVGNKATITKIESVQSF